MIASFGDSRTADVYHGRRSRASDRLAGSVRAAAARKLDMIVAARELKDLRSPPGNRLEVLRGDLRGFYSIRVNQRWRVIFRWEQGEAYEVRLIDYH